MKPVYIVNKIIAKLADGLGNALTSTTVGADQALDVNIVQTVASGGSDPVGLKNASSTTINPATEETLQDVAMLLSRLGYKVDDTGKLQIVVKNSSTDPANVQLTTSNITGIQSLADRPPIHILKTMQAMSNLTQIV